ncbi:MAG: tetratricopeptide repeat protein [Chloroflexota bacterium]|nr:O-antigen ligase family protein [Chloroflexota bacterium]MBI5702054.1 O-antigen ligase family protein [Chloroflexota bacterium]
MRELVEDHRFALLELLLIALCGAVWVIEPGWGLWFLPTALLPFALRLVSGGYSFDGRDVLVLLFGVTAWGGYWAAYDQTTAWSKAWLLMTAILLYFSLKAQPHENLSRISVFLFCLGVGVALYFFLTHDFVALPRRLEMVNRLGRWMMSIRPQTGWTPIHPNYVAGMIAITVPFILYPLEKLRQARAPLSLKWLLPLGAGVSLAMLAMLMSTSRGVTFAVLSGAGGWLGWRLIHSGRIRRQIKSEALFPVLLMMYLGAAVAFLYAGPARSGSLFTGHYYYGNGSRGELFGRSLYLLQDYALTGGGLGAFPGLYSQYLLDIPFYNVPNSHNLFLDVGIEQGVLGGAAFLGLYVLSLWSLAQGLGRRGEGGTFQALLLFALLAAFVHGMVDDYLYNGAGAALSLFLVGLAENLRRREPQPAIHRIDRRTALAIALIWLLAALFNLKQIRAVWQANLGAVQLAKVELAEFPESGWAGERIVPHLAAADASLQTALGLDPANRTANHRLGLIAMYRRDFVSATRFLEAALDRSPSHRGIIKALAYCYVWLGDVERAQVFLAQIPEAAEELDVYIWWWQTQNREDLSANARLALEALDAAPAQP